MDLSTGRDKNSIYSYNNFMPDYNPNYEKCKKKLSTCILPFEKIISRKPLLNPKSTLNEAHYDYDFY